MASTEAASESPAEATADLDTKTWMLFPKEIPDPEPLWKACFM